MFYKEIRIHLNVIRILPALIAYLLSPEKITIRQDIAVFIKDYNIEKLKYSFWKNLQYLMLFYPEYRNLYYYRIKKGSFLLSKLIEPFYPRLATFDIVTDSIGSGLLITHGYCTLIYAKSIGENCRIFHEVTIGSLKGDSPTIGDNVVINPGAKISGNIRIGNNSIIGANSVVIRDVPDNCTAAGIPAHIIYNQEWSTKKESSKNKQLEHLISSLS
jgi:serine O-acetyltransferase